jgi:predicted DNA-binding transcriptional regulator AlpA
MAIEYLTTAGFADLLGLSVSTIEGYSRNGKLPAPDARAGRYKGYLPQTIEEWERRRPGVRTPRADENWHIFPHSTITYLTVPEFAERIGVVRGAMNRYKLPPEDARIGAIRCYLPQTIDAWNERRPKRGRTSAENADWHLPPELRHGSK